MQRISRDQMWMMMAEVAAMRSTCRRLSVGAIIVDKRNNVVAVGYNGPPSGEPHCTGDACGIPHCTRAKHAEENALGRILLPYSPLALTMYVTNSPCEHCWQKIVDRGVVGRVVFKNEYRISQHLKVYCGIQIEKITASGYVTDFITGHLVSGPEEA
jgi:dCMP deaminase